MLVFQNKPRDLASWGFPSNMQDSAHLGEQQTTLWWQYNSWNIAENRKLYYYKCKKQLLLGPKRCCGSHMVIVHQGLLKLLSAARSISPPGNRIAKNFNHIS